MKKISIKSIKNDYVLVALVMVLWAYGRILNSLLSISLLGANSPTSVLSIAAVVYILLHAVVFIFAAWLFISSNPLLIKRNRPHHASVWQIVLYCYVLIMIAVSLYFFAYEFGA
jgi:hypothetical protein